MTLRNAEGRLLSITQTSVPRLSTTTAKHDVAETYTRPQVLNVFESTVFALQQDKAGVTLVNAPCQLGTAKKNVALSETSKLSSQTVAT